MIRIFAKKRQKNSDLTALGRHKMRKKANKPKSPHKSVVSIPKITYKKNWAIFMKIEGGDTISAEVFFFILLRIYSDFAPILLRFCSDLFRFR